MSRKETDPQVQSVIRYTSSGPPAALKEPETLETSKQEEWITSRKREVTTTRQVETRIQRQVVLEDGEVIKDSGPTVTTDTAEDVVTQEHENTEHITSGEEPPPTSGWVAIPGAKIVSDKREKKQVTREEKHDVTETEEEEVLGDVSHAGLVRALNARAHERMELLKPESRELTQSAGPRVILQTSNMKKTIDTEDLEEHSELVDGELRTEKTKTMYHKDIIDREVPEESEGDSMVEREERQNTSWQKDPNRSATRGRRDPRLYPPDRRETYSRPLMELQADEARKFETSKWLENHFGSSGSEGGEEKGPRRGSSIINIKLDGGPIRSPLVTSTPPPVPPPKPRTSQYGREEEKQPFPMYSTVNKSSTSRRYEEESSMDAVPRVTRYLRETTETPTREQRMRYSSESTEDRQARYRTELEANREKHYRTELAMETTPSAPRFKEMNFKVERSPDKDDWVLRKISRSSSLNGDRSRQSLLKKEYDEIYREVLAEEAQTRRGPRDSAPHAPPPPVSATAGDAGERPSSVKRGVYRSAKDASFYRSTPALLTNSASEERNSASQERGRRTITQRVMETGGHRPAARVISDPKSATLGRHVTTTNLTETVPGTSSLRRSGTKVADISHATAPPPTRPERRKKKARPESGEQPPTSSSVYGYSTTASSHADFENVAVYTHAPRVVERLPRSQSERRPERGNMKWFSTSKRESSLHSSSSKAGGQENARTSTTYIRTGTEVHPQTTYYLGEDPFRGGLFNHEKYDNVRDVKREVRLLKRQTEKDYSSSEAPVVVRQPNRTPRHPKIGPTRSDPSSRQSEKRTDTVDVTPSGYSREHHEQGTTAGGFYTRDYVESRSKTHTPGGTTEESRIVRRSNDEYSSMPNGRHAQQATPYNAMGSVTLDRSWKHRDTKSRVTDSGSETKNTSTGSDKGSSSINISIKNEVKESRNAPTPPAKPARAVNRSQSFNVANGNLIAGTSSRVDIIDYKPLSRGTSLTRLDDTASPLKCPDIVKKVQRSASMRRNGSLYLDREEWDPAFTKPDAQPDSFPASTPLRASESPLTSRFNKSESFTARQSMLSKKLQLADDEGEDTKRQKFLQGLRNAAPELYQHLHGEPDDSQRQVRKFNAPPMEQSAKTPAPFHRGRSPTKDEEKTKSTVTKRLVLSENGGPPRTETIERTETSRRTHHRTHEQELMRPKTAFSQHFKYLQAPPVQSLIEVRDWNSR